MSCGDVLTIDLCRQSTALYWLVGCHGMYTCHILESSTDMQRYNIQGAFMRSGELYILPEERQIELRINLCSKLAFLLRKTNG